MRWVSGCNHHVREIFNGSAFRGLAVGAAALFAFPPDAGAATPFALKRLGFYDTSYTRPDGVQTSGLFGLTEAGTAVGYSYRYSGASLLGATLWIEPVAAPGPIAVGIYDAAHTRADGTFSISMAQITESGLTRGESGRFLGGTANLGQTAWVSSAAGVTSVLGFYDAEHTGAGGYQLSATTELNEAGNLRGTSQRFGAGGVSMGQTAWVGSVTGTTTRVGFFATPEYQRADGFRFSSADFMNSSGQVAGLSDRYNGGTNYLGQAAWVTVGGTTTQVGFIATPEFKDTGDYAFSAVQQFTDAGKARGYSERFSGAISNGQAAWVTDAAGATTRVGLVDAEHTKSDGYQFSNAEELTASGLLRGNSKRFSGGATDLGQTAWVANGAGATFKVGLYDAENTKTGGYQKSTTAEINETGVVTGISLRYNAADSRGQSAWKASFDGTTQPTTTRIGLIDAEHTSSIGSQTSTPEILTGSGIIGGSSSRYNNTATFLGQSAWVVASGSSTTTKVGLTSAEFTRADGWKYSGLEQITESGKIAGYSERFNGGSPSLGQAVWVGTVAGVTQRVGLTDPAYTSATGVQFSEFQELTESGFASGWSNRYNATAGQVGQTSWVFDLNTTTLTPFVFSTRVSDGYAYSEVLGLLENGMAYGTYTLFDGAGVDLGNRAFAWTPGGAAFDLGANVDGGLTAAGFANLIGASDGTPSGLLAGGGTPLTNTGQAVYLAQAVPEPGTIFLLVLAVPLLALVARRRGQNSSLLSK